MLLPPPSNTDDEALDSLLSRQVLGERLQYPECQAGFKPAPESTRTHQTSESKRVSVGGVTPGSNPDIRVRSHALVAGDDAEKPVGSDGKASILAGFPRQGQEGAMDELGRDDSDNETGIPQQEEPQEKASSAAPAEGENASDGACAADAGKEKEALDGKALEKAALAALGLDDSDGSYSDPGMVGGGGPRRRKRMKRATMLADIQRVLFVRSRDIMHLNARFSPKVSMCLKNCRKLKMHRSPCLRSPCRRKRLRNRNRWTGNFVRAWKI